MLTLRQLQYLDALAQCGHFGRAAEQCSVTQPALSMQIRDLEMELGAILIERLPGGARLTETGREVAERAAQVLIDVQDLKDFAKHRREVLSGGLNLGVIPSIAPYLLPPLLPRLREVYPEVQLRIRESQTERIVSELASGVLDVLLLALPVEDGDFETLHVFDDPFLLATHREHTLSGKVSLSPEALGPHRMLLLEEGHCFRDQALAYCALRKVDDIDTYGASTLATVVQMVANGMGMTLLPEISLSLDGRDPHIAIHKLEDPVPSRQIGLVWRRSSPRQADFAALGELVREAHASLIASTPFGDDGR